MEVGFIVRIVVLEVVILWLWFILMISMVIIFGVLFIVMVFGFVFISCIFMGVVIIGGLIFLFFFILYVILFIYIYFKWKLWSGVD